jgi:hypothetical protein
MRSVTISGLRLGGITLLWPSACPLAEILCGLLPRGKQQPYFCGRCAWPLVGLEVCRPGLCWVLGSRFWFLLHQGCGMMPVSAPQYDFNHVSLPMNGRDRPCSGPRDGQKMTIRHFQPCTPSSALIIRKKHISCPTWQ